MTTLATPPQIVWEERDERGQHVYGVATVRLLASSGGWLVWGSHDFPMQERQANDCAAPSDYRPLDVTLAAGMRRQEIEEFDREHEAFVRLSPIVQTQHRGRFVAIHAGRIVDSDVNRQDLVKRFFERNGNVSVYIGYIGESPVAYQVTPFQI